MKKKYNLLAFAQELPVIFQLMTYKWKKDYNTGAIYHSRFNEKKAYNSEVSECFSPNKPVSKLL
jgi:hypothetical protein